MKRPSLTSLSRWTLLALLPLSLSWATLGCGDEAETTVASDRLSDAEPQPSAQPLTLSKENTAIPLRPPLRRGDEYRGDLTLIKTNSSFDTLTNQLGAAVITLQVLDEREATTSPEDPQQNPAPFQAGKRSRDLVAEIDGALTESGNPDWAEYVLVVDLFRLKRNWLVRWDGTNIRQFEEPGEYGLWRDDMRQDLKAIMVGAVNELLGRGKPLKRVVFGVGMERLLASSDGGVNPTDYANFVTLFREVKAELATQAPEVEVSAGLNWDNLVTHVAALYTATGKLEDVKFGEIRAAWRDVAEPLYADADFIALSSEPDPSLYNGNPANLPQSHYALLAEVQGPRPVVWHSIHWPVESKAVKALQDDYLERFLALNGGNDVALVSWKQLIDLPEGAADCNSLVSLGAPPSDCYAGLFSDSVAPTDLSDSYLPAASE